MRASRVPPIQGGDRARGGFPLLVFLLLHLTLMASPLHGRTMPRVAFPDTATSAAMADMVPMATGVGLASPASASHPVLDCRLQPASPPAWPVPRALPCGTLLLWAPPMADTAVTVGPRFQPPNPVHLADPQALLQVFRV